MTLQPPPPSRYPGADSYERNLQRIRLRQDTEGNWLRNDPTPASGEMCYTIGGQDAGSVLKVGDGTRRWSELPYLAAQGNSGTSGPPGADGHSITVYGPSALPPSPTVTPLYAGDMWLSDGLYAQNPSFDAGIIGPGAQGPAGEAATIDAVSAVALPNTNPPTVNNVGDKVHANFIFGIPAGPQGVAGIQGPIGVAGPQGPAGDTFKISGAVANVAALDPAPPNLSVFITQDNSHLHIYDPTSGAAGANGYVDLGAISGPQGVSAFFSNPVADAASLPATGAAGQCIIALDTGHMHSWDTVNLRWNDAGKIVGPSGSGISDGTAEGQIPIWSVTFNAWTPTVPTLGVMSDVDASTQKDGTPLEDADLLAYDLADASWKAVSKADYFSNEIVLANIGDVDSTPPTDRQMLAWDATNSVWKGMDQPTGINKWSPDAWVKGDIVLYNNNIWQALADIPRGSGAPGLSYITGLMQIAPGISSGTLIQIELNPAGSANINLTYTAGGGDSDPLILAGHLADFLNADPASSAVALFTVDRDRVLVAGKTAQVTAVPHSPISSASMSATSDWKPVTSIGLGGLEDVDLSSTPPLNGQTLIFDNTTGKWVPGDISGASPIVFLGTGAWNSGAALDGSDSFYGMPAGTTPSPTDYPPIPGDSYIDLSTGLVTTFTGAVTNTRRAGSISGGGGSLDIVRERLQDLDDVANTAPGNNNLLMYDGVQNQWTPVPNSFATLSYVDNRVEALAIGLAHDVAVASITNTPPDGPSNANIYYIVGKNPTGDWAGNANNVAHYTMGSGGSYSWHFETPRDNETHLVEDQSANYSWNGTEWVKVASGTGAPVNVEDLQNVNHDAKANGDILIYSADANTWLGAPVQSITDILYYKKTETYTKAEIDAKLSPEFFTKGYWGNTNSALIYCQAPSGRSSTECAELHGYLQADGGNYCIQPYLYFADGHECNFAVTTNKAHAYHVLQYKDGGTADNGATFIQNHQCRWTFRNVANYDVKLGHPMFFEFRCYRIGSYWEIQWTGHYLSANSTPMSFTGGLEYNYNSNITRIGVRGYRFNSDNTYGLKGRMYYEGL